MQVFVFGEELELLQQKAVFWPARKVLVVADLHLGKVNHFRKAGIPVPTKANMKNWELLVEILISKKPERVIFLGDLFHSHYNYEWETVGELIRNFPGISFELVIGNHDILSDVQYTRHKISVHEELSIDPFLFTHHPLEVLDEKKYNIAGHIHPGVRLVGRGRQAMTLPCFHFGPNQGYLPAFGMFTGFVRIRPGKGDQVFVIADEEIITV
jgi:DNA ligase-associated metallophosphoesterase